jgi:hypothetical protein
LSDNSSSKNYDLRTTPKIVYESLYDNEKARQWFPTIFVIHNNESINIEQLQMDGIEYVARIKEAIPYSSIKGTIESLDGKTKQSFEWIITPNESVKNWTRLTTKTISTQKYVRWISPLPAAGATLGLIVYLENGFASMSSAYAVTATSFAPISSSIISQTVAVSETTGKSITISKTFLTAITMSIVAAGGGIILGDVYYSDPFVQYSLYPPQLPADLHGTSLIVKNVYATDVKSEIIQYDCDTELTVQESNYTFDCITKNSLGNKETVTTTVYVKGPRNLLDKIATDCVSQHYTLSDDIVKDYPYLLDLPNISPSRLSDLKNNHINLTDNYYEQHDYVSAKKHATIILRYFSINDVQALSTLANIMRDENRNDISGIKCALAVHTTPFISNTVWGKISTAEDYHVFGDYETSIQWSSRVIDDYPTNSDIDEINYVNALIIKGNALYRMSLVEQSGFDDAKMYYTLAHDIKKSYDTWFGLGNIDRHENRPTDALEKYQQAKLLADNTDEINEAINRVSFK